MPTYDSQYTGLEIDQAVAKFLHIEDQGGVITSNEVDEKLEDYLSITSAASTYLSKTDAASTYLKITDAASTYLTKSDANSTFRVNSEHTSTVSFRAAMGQDQNTTTGAYAFLDNYVHATLRTSTNYNKTVLGFGTAGPNYGCVVMFHATGNYYGGIVWNYSGEFTRFGYTNGTFHIWNW